MKKAEFPKVIRVGHTKATIYKTPSHECDSFTVVWYEGEMRKRKSFSDFQMAKTHAEARVNNLSRGEAEILRLNGEELLSYTRAREALREFGVSLDTIAMEYRDAKRLVPGRSLVDVARVFVDEHSLDLPARSVRQVYEEMIEAKRAEGLSARYLSDLRSRAGKFASEFGKMISEVKGPEIKLWLQELRREGSKERPGETPPPVSNRTRNNFRVAIQTLFSFAKAQRYLTSSWNGMESVPVWKTRGDEVEIFRPDELSVLLGLASEDLVPYLAIGAFAGLRSAEMERLDWSKVNLKSGYITVDASIAKTNSRRLVPITPNLRLWLENVAKASGPVVQERNVARSVRGLTEATRPVDPEDPKRRLPAVVAWKHNVLRHSFCSYRLADVKSAAQVALEAGNSPQMVFKHYRELVTAEAAKDWFAVTPESAKALRERAEAERMAKIVVLPAKATAAA